MHARRALWEGGQAAVDASTDPLVVAMRTVEPAAMAARKQRDDAVEAPMRGLGRKVAEAKFAVDGTSVAPDATFTLRLSVGVVRGYTEHGKHVPWATDFAGMYRHATGVEPVQAAGALGRPRREETPHDDDAAELRVDQRHHRRQLREPRRGAAGDLVGLIFDGNLPSLPDRFIYHETTARAVSVDTAAMLEALRTVYGADALVEELDDAMEVVEAGDFFFFFFFFFVSYVYTHPRRVHNDCGTKR